MPVKGKFNHLLFRGQVRIQQSLIGRNFFSKFIQSFIYLYWELSEVQLWNILYVIGSTINTCDMNSYATVSWFSNSISPAVSAPCRKSRSGISAMSALIRAPIVWWQNWKIFWHFFSQFSSLNKLKIHQNIQTWQQNSWLLQKYTCSIIYIKSDGLHLNL